jgi:acyl-CoA thioesterase-1
MVRLLLLAGLLMPISCLADRPPTLLVLGDSLSAAYGLAAHEGWVSLLSERLKRRGYPHLVVNASVSGETTAGGLTRLPSLLERHQPGVLVIQLGANDGLRGLHFDETRANLARLIALGRGAAARPLMIGIRLPPNYGAAYIERFQAIFPELARAQEVALVPRLLEGVAEDRRLMQADGLHPLAEAQPRILDNVWPALEPLLSPAAEAEDGP